MRATEWRGCHSVMSSYARATCARGYGGQSAPEEAWCTQITIESFVSILESLLSLDDLPLRHLCFYQFWFVRCRPAGFVYEKTISFKVGIKLKPGTFSSGWSKITRRKKWSTKMRDDDRQQRSNIFAQ